MWNPAPKPSDFFTNDMASLRKPWKGGDHTQCLEATLMDPMKDNSFLPHVAAWELAFVRVLNVEMVDIIHHAASFTNTVDFIPTVRASLQTCTHRQFNHC
jgi:hypothetical protein